MAEWFCFSSLTTSYTRARNVIALLNRCFSDEVLHLHRAVWLVRDIFKLDWHSVERIPPPRSNSPLKFNQAKFNPWSNTPWHRVRPSLERSSFPTAGSCSFSNLRKERTITIHCSIRLSKRPFKYQTSRFGFGMAADPSYSPRASLFWRVENETQESGFLAIISYFKQTASAWKINVCITNGCNWMKPVNVTEPYSYFKGSVCRIYEDLWAELMFNIQYWSSWV